MKAGARCTTRLASRVRVPIGDYSTKPRSVACYCRQLPLLLRGRAACCQRSATTAQQSGLLATGPLSALPQQPVVLLPAGFCVAARAAASANIGQASVARLWDKLAGLRLPHSPHFVDSPPPDTGNLLS